MQPHRQLPPPLTASVPLPAVAGNSSAAARASPALQRRRRRLPFIKKSGVARLATRANNKLLVRKANLASLPCGSLMFALLPFLLRTAPPPWPRGASSWASQTASAGRQVSVRQASGQAPPGWRVASATSRCAELVALSQPVACATATVRGLCRRVPSRRKRPLCLAPVGSGSRAAGSASRRASTARSRKGLFSGP